MAFILDSKIQEGFNAGAVAADIDYGPYSGDQWARMFRILHTSDQENDQGVVRGYEDELEVSHIGTTVYVDEGAGLCNGHFMVGVGTPIWSVAVTPPTAGHTRCDYVVMLENNTAGVYAPGAATMQTPNSADYGGVANQVPEFACRLAIIKGAEDAACPPAIFSQTTALFMIPLAKIEWDVAQAIDTLTDMRHYIHEYDVDILVPAVNGYNSSDDTWLGSGFWLSFLMPDAKDCNLYGHWRVPPEYVRGLTIDTVVTSNDTGNLWARLQTKYGALGENTATHNADIVAAAVAVPLANVWQEILQTTPADVNIGDYFSWLYTRYGSNVNDTIDADHYPIGWRVQYTAAIPWD